MIKWIKKFIDNLAKSNNETYQGRPLDCCSLNKDAGKNQLKEK